MRRFAETCEAIAATTKKLEKTRLVAEYLLSLSLEEAAHAAVFFSGRPFAARDERTLGIGGRLLVGVVKRIAGVDDAALHAAYRNHGDLGGAAAELLHRHKPTGQPLTLAGLVMAFAELAAQRTAAQKSATLEALLARASAPEAKYIIKILTGDLRIGLKESLVEEAIARAWEQAAAAVQRANMLTGDIGETARLAAANALASAPFRIGHAIGFMLASPAETAAEAMEYFPEGALVEDKYDGIRAQVHKFTSSSGAASVRLFSRTLDEITEFPEIADAVKRLAGEFVLDAEIIGWSEGATPSEPGRALPFTQLQQRLGRKQSQMGLWQQADVPVRLVAFDLLARDGAVLLDEPLAARRAALEELLRYCASDSVVGLAPAAPCASAEAMDAAFEEALARGNEGLMIKSPQSLYTPGRRGKTWLKLKRPFASLDVVVTTVEYGHGKRHRVLSDYTFSVRDDTAADPDALVTIGKAYSGLTDKEIAELTEWFMAHTIEDRGFSRTVEPCIVIEVAFQNIQRSTRHQSGFALRFPRILRLRPDKSAREVDTLSQVRELFASQFRSESTTKKESK